ncbi:hypothetical protein RA27_03245 [Ruegeria sp. ANG-R]|nr:hypothetical protein RA27_03245 [Ruegeria sp. ANG-R]
MIQATVAYTADFIVRKRDSKLSPAIEFELKKKPFVTVEETFPSGNRAYVTADVKNIGELRKRLGENYVASSLPKMEPY